MRDIASHGCYYICKWVVLLWLMRCNFQARIFRAPFGPAHCWAFFKDKIALFHFERISRKKLGFRPYTYISGHLGLVKYLCCIKISFSLQQIVCRSFLSAFVPVSIRIYLCEHSPSQYEDIWIRVNKRWKRQWATLSSNNNVISPEGLLNNSRGLKAAQWTQIFVLWRGTKS